MYTSIADRLRFFCLATLVIFLFGWVWLFFPFASLIGRNGQPLGADFPVFYVPASMVWQGEATQLYDPLASQEAVHEILPALPAGHWWPNRYPAFVSLILAPLAALPYGIAFGVFFIASLGALVAAIVALRNLQIAQRYPGTFVIAVIGCPLVLETLAGAQGSLFTLAIAAGSVRLVSKRPATAGALLAIALFKPNALAFFILGYGLKYPRLWLGFLPVALILGAVSWATAGTGAMQEYFELSFQLASQPWAVETNPLKVHGLSSFVPRPLLLISGLAATAIIVRFWPGHVAGSALLLSTNVVFNPYVPIYDLVLLLLSAILTLEALSDREATNDHSVMIQIMLGLVFLGPHISQSLMPSLGFQVFPLLLFPAWLWQMRELAQFRKSNERVLLARTPV